MVKFADYYQEQPLKEHPPVTAFIDGEWTYEKIKGRKIERDKFEEWKTTYYKLEGWDPETGIPTRERLSALSLGWVEDLLT